LHRQAPEIQSLQAYRVLFGGQRESRSDRTRTVDDVIDILLRERMVVGKCDGFDGGAARR